MLKVILKVILQIMHMHIPIRVALPRRNMEVTNDLVDADATLDAAAFSSLFVEVLGVVLALALLDAVAAAEGPGYRGIGVAHFVAGLAAAFFFAVRRGRRPVAAAAIVRGEVGGWVVGVSGRKGSALRHCKLRIKLQNCPT
jgi:hypothetical protein